MAEGADIQPPADKRMTKVSGLVIVIGAMISLGAFSIDVTLAAFPRFVSELGASPAQAQWTMSTYLLGISFGQLILGPLTDSWGRRPVVLAALAIFVVIALICSVMNVIEVIIVLRVFQGMMGASGGVVGRAVIRDVFDRQEGARLLSMSMMLMNVTLFVSPVIGGFLVTYFGWRSVFLAMALLGSFVITRTFFSLPETLAPENRSPLRVARLVHAYREFLTNRTCVSYMLLQALSIAGILAYVTGSPMMIVDIFGYREDQYGYFFMLTASSMLLANYLNSRLLKKVSSAIMTRAGVIMLGVATVMIAVTTLGGIGGLAGIMVSMMVYVFGGGLVLPNATASALEPVGRIAGTAASLLGAVQSLACTLASATVAATYQGTTAAMGGTMIAVASGAILVYILIVPSPGEEESETLSAQ